MNRPVRDEPRGTLGPALSQRAAFSPAEMHAALGALRTGVAIVAQDWTVAYANSAWGALFGESSVGEQLWTAIPALGEGTARETLHGVMADGRVRAMRVPSRSADHAPLLELRAVRIAGGYLTLEARDAGTGAELADAAGENRLLRELSQHLAAVPDTRRLFTLLSETVRRECGGMGAGLTVLVGGDVHVLASSGRGIPEPGTSFPIRGSLSERAAVLRRVLRQRGYRAPAPQVQAVFDAEGVCELMMAPLVAYDQTVGILATVRGKDDAPFSARDERRLQIIADHAAVAVWKSRLLEEARAASQAKSNFLATMSHELLTPLTALTGYGELLTDEILGPLSNQQHEMVERMRSVTHHLSGMIDEILTFSSLEAGRERVQTAELASADMLRAAAAVVEPSARSRGLEFTLGIPADAPMLVSDADKVRQILINLGSNAVKFTDEGGVHMSVRGEDGEVRFGVRDTGMGIADEDQRRLYQPFTQLDASLTRRHGGTGLGLYIASQLAELLGGRIECRSRPGEGSTFELVLAMRAPG